MFWSKGKINTGNLWSRKEDSDSVKKSKKSDKTAKENQKKEAEDKVATNNPNIRVLLKTSGYAEEVHPSVALSSEAGLVAECGGEQK